MCLLYVFLINIDIELRVRNLTIITGGVVSVSLWSQFVEGTKKIKTRCRLALVSICSPGVKRP